MSVLHTKETADPNDRLFPPGTGEVEDFKVNTNTGSSIENIISWMNGHVLRRKIIFYRVLKETKESNDVDTTTYTVECWYKQP